MKQISPQHYSAPKPESTVRPQQPDAMTFKKDDPEQYDMLTVILLSIVGTLGVGFIIYTIYTIFTISCS